MQIQPFNFGWNGHAEPDYRSVLLWRIKTLQAFRANPDLLRGAKEYYRHRPVEFIENWLSTYDPRLAGTDKPSTMPFILFPRQREFIHWLHQLVLLQNNGLVEKSRDAGITWCCSAFSVWAWIFISESSIGWGSRVEDLVDKIGDADSILEKIRILLRLTPPEFLPRGFSVDSHTPFMRILNPETQASITGDAGKNIGRGGRKLAYFVDEAAHLENPEAAEAAISENTRVRVDVSSVNGPNNVFHRKRKAGVVWHPMIPMDRTKTSVFIFDWRDDPRKTEQWYRIKKNDWEEKGLPHIFAQEVDRNYNASVQGIIIKAEWVAAAFGAAEAMGFDDEGLWTAGLDVADEGGDKNAVTIRKGPVLKHCEAWGEGDTGKTTRRAVIACRDTARGGTISLQYDCIGVGAGVKAEANRLVDERLVPETMNFVPWNAGAAVLFPDRNLVRGDRESPLNKDVFRNLKAQAWFEVARRFERTYKARQLHSELLEARKNPEGVFEVYDPADLISIPADHKARYQLENELTQAVWKDGSSSLKMIVDKSPNGADSPNLADSLVMAYFPVKSGLLLWSEKALQ